VAAAHSFYIASGEVLAVAVIPARVLGVVTAREYVFQSKIVIDATEFGDVLPLTSAAYRIGRFTSLWTEKDVET
jgi:hypothetical protein